MSETIGRVLGTLDAMPLEFWVAVEDGQYLQLDDVVEVETPLPDGSTVRLYGVVDLVRARHEGARLDSDVFLVEKGVLPAMVAEAAHVRVTRVEPEIFVPPRPGQPVRRASGLRRDEALFFDGMERKVPIGLSRDGEPVYANLDFLDGSRGAHVNISGISGVATKTSYATFLLHSLFSCGALGGEAANTHALVFNVKGEDLLFLDEPNARLREEDRKAYAKLGLPAESFGSVQILAPVRKDSPERLAATGSRTGGVTAFFWTVRELVVERLLRFLFAETDDASSQLELRRGQDRGEAGRRRRGEGAAGRSLDRGRGDADRQLRRARGSAHGPPRRRREPGRALGKTRRPRYGRGLRAAAARRRAARRPPDPGQGRRPARGAPARLEEDAALGRRHPRAARSRQALRGGGRAEADVRGEGVARHARGRSCSWCSTSSTSTRRARAAGRSRRCCSTSRSAGAASGSCWSARSRRRARSRARIVANAALRVVGRLDTAEAERPEYGFLSAAGRGRAGILKPGTMIVQQPEIPTPLLVRFPFPAWATRKAEVSEPAGQDPFAGFR